MSIHCTAVVDSGAALDESVVVGPYAIINKNVHIGAGTVVHAHAYIDSGTTIGRDCLISPSVVLGTPPQDISYQGEETRLVIGDRVHIREFANINRGTVKGHGVTTVGNDCFLMAYAHVGHDCQIGNNVILVNNLAMAGHVTVEDGVTISGTCAIHQFARIGAHAFIGGFSRVTKDVPPYVIAQGADDFKLYGPNVIGLKRKGYPTSTITAIREAFRIIFRSSSLIKDALEEALASFPDSAEVKNMVDFVRASDRGVVR